MKKFTYPLMLLMLMLIGSMSCKKEAWDAYYGRPATLEPPIYQVLESKGNFKSFLSVIDKSGYKKTLSSAGYWTVFAPHDSAFQVYITENGITGIAQLDSAACQKLVTYALVYNAYKKERIGDFQSNIGWVPNAAFKRRTANYVGVYDGKDSSGKAIKIISSNRNNNGITYFVDADNNSKHLPYFVDNFMASKGLTAADYNYFYPKTTYTGFNVADATVTEKDIPAENGVIHVVNRVLTVLPGLDEYISSRPEYSEFKKIFDRFLVQYALNPTATQKYQAINGGSASVYTKIFNSNLAFSPNNENFTKLQDNDAQSNTYTMFVPTNDVLTTYINTVLLKHYTSLAAMPINIIYDFVNAHMWQSAVWPSKFATTFNYLGEEARFSSSTDIVDKKFLSNAIFYGTKKVQEANVFSSVYGKAYLNPNYTMMTSLLNQELKFQVSNVRQKYTLFLVSNAVLNAAGYFADPTVDNNINNQWRYIPPAGGTQLTGSSALVRLLRVINMHIVPQVDIKSTASNGVANTYSGEFIKFSNNTVIGAGNFDVGNVAKVLSSESAQNGTVHYIDRIINFSEKTIGKHIELLGTPPTSEFNSFWQFLRNSSIYTLATGDITSVASGTFYTMFIPNNSAIRAAVNAGLLPGTGVAPNKVPLFNPTLPADRELVVKFIYAHILNKKTVGTDGLESGSYETLQKTGNGDPNNVFVNNSALNVMSLTDMSSRNSKVILASSNFLSNRCTIHLIDNYLKYNN
jgi:uncharacterized surface protein with fasciclin (FAS1) repeats